MITGTRANLKLASFRHLCVISLGNASSSTPRSVLTSSMIHCPRTCCCDVINHVNSMEECETDAPPALCVSIRYDVVMLPYFVPVDLKSQFCFAFTVRPMREDYDESKREWLRMSFNTMSTGTAAKHCLPVQCQFLQIFFRSLWSLTTLIHVLNSLLKKLSVNVAFWQGFCFPWKMFDFRKTRFLNVRPFSYIRGPALSGAAF